MDFDRAFLGAFNNVYPVKQECLHRSIAQPTNWLSGELGTGPIVDIRFKWLMCFKWPVRC